MTNASIFLWQWSQMREPRYNAIFPTRQNATKRLMHSAALIFNQPEKGP